MEIEEKLLEGKGESGEWMGCCHGFVLKMEKK
jgi:hypothetical protein